MTSDPVLRLAVLVAGRGCLPSHLRLAIVMTLAKFQQPWFGDKGKYGWRITMKIKHKTYAAIFNDGRHAFYKSWPECEKAVTGVSRVEHKSFKTMAEAEAWVEQTLRTEKPYTTDAHNQRNQVPNKNFPASPWFEEESSKKK